MDNVADLHALVPAGRRDACEAALRVRIFARDLVVRDAPPGTYLVRDDRFYDDATAARRGAALGALVGLALGVLAAVLGVFAGGATLLLVAGAAVFAAGVGAVIGLQRHEVFDADPVTTFEVEPGAYSLFTVHTAHWDSFAHRTVCRHGARLVEQDLPLPAPS
ncbi:hypothetical protein [Egicoccus sp. AB-alg2]|uniref:hypothetical protein n=1 Tax=Egicoccus sp. AB-alg2 TaxID=3242693 RepID=UPI00359CD476